MFLAPSADNKTRNYDRGYSKSTFFEEGRRGGGVSFKSEQKRTERDGVTCEYVRF